MTKTTGHPSRRKDGRDADRKIEENPRVCRADGGPRARPIRACGAVARDGLGGAG